MWNAISLVQDLNACRRVHFLRTETVIIHGSKVQTICWVWHQFDFPPTPSSWNFITGSSDIRFCYKRDHIVLANSGYYCRKLVYIRFSCLEHRLASMARLSGINSVNHLICYSTRRKSSPSVRNTLIVQNIAKLLTSNVITYIINIPWRHAFFFSDYGKMLGCLLNSNVGLDLVWFYGISTVRSYLIPNPVYTYILRYIWLVKHFVDNIRKRAWTLLHIVKWFQVLLCNSYNLRSVCSQGPIYK